MIPTRGEQDPERACSPLCFHGQPQSARTILRTRPPRLLRGLVATQAWKSPWLVTVLETYGGRSATEATVEPPATKSRNQEVKIPDGRLLTGQWDGAMRGTP